jgi:hypothetical protein
VLTVWIMGACREALVSIQRVAQPSSGIKRVQIEFDTEMHSRMRSDREAWLTHDALRPKDSAFARHFERLAMRLKDGALRSVAKPILYRATWIDWHRVWPPT